MYESLGIDYEPGDIGSQTETAEDVAEAGADKTTARMLKEIQARLDKLSGGRREIEMRQEQAHREMMMERMDSMEATVKELKDDA